MAELTRKGLLAGGVVGAAAIRDLSGAVVFTARGTVAADRITV